MMVFATRRRNEKPQMPEVGTVWRRMLRVATLLAPGEQFRALLVIELPPDVARCGHGMRLTEPRKRGTPNQANLRFCCEFRL
jgi:hypothetical protein